MMKRSEIQLLKMHSVLILTFGIFISFLMSCQIKKHNSRPHLMYGTASADYKTMKK
jgi:hypothetical protein